MVALGGVRLDFHEKCCKRIDWNRAYPKINCWKKTNMTQLVEPVDLFRSLFQSSGWIFSTNGKSVKNQTQHHTRVVRFAQAALLKHPPSQPGSVGESPLEMKDLWTWDWPAALKPWVFVRCRVFPPLFGGFSDSCEQRLFLFEVILEFSKSHSQFH